MRPSALILSPTPPIPRDFGNRNRVFQTCSFFLERGFETSLVLYPLDNDWSKGIPEYYSELKHMFSYISIIPNSHKLHQPATLSHHDIDEWWDDNIAVELEWLFKRKKFDVLFVNYTFLSKACEMCPKTTLSILDTHDVFSGRREMFEAQGVKPEFFYTKQDEESVGLNRADVVLGIKASEADLFRTMSTSTVISIPYRHAVDVEPGRKGAPARRRRGSGPLVAGFIGAQNSVNVVNMQHFLKAFESHPLCGSGSVEIQIAGDVCNGLRSSPNVKLLGRVQSKSEFYGALDIVVAPLDFSTGIKIKVAEALAFGKPVVATANAFDGFAVRHEMQSLATVEDVADALFKLAGDRSALSALKKASLGSRAANEADASAGLAELETRISGTLQRFIIFIDRPIWYRANFYDEFLCQALEITGQMGRAIVVSLCADKVRSERIYADFDVLAAAPDVVDAEIAKLTKTFRLRAAVDLCEQPRNSQSVRELLGGKVEIVSFRKDLVFQGRVGVGFTSSRSTLEVPPLRYVPVSYRMSKAVDFDYVILYRAGEHDDLAGQLHEVVTRSGSSSVVVECGAYEEFSSEFFAFVGSIKRSRLIFIGGERVDWVFTRQLLEIEGCDMVHVAEPGRLSEALSTDPIKSSRQGAVDLLERLGSRDWVRPNPNGWGEYWRQMTSPLQAAAE